MNGDSSVMSDVIYWALWAVVWVAPGLVTALIARDRGRPVWRWLIVGVIFSWIALIAIVLLPDKSGQPHVSVQEWEEEKARSAAEPDAAEQDGSETARSAAEHDGSEQDGSEKARSAAEHDVSEQDGSETARSAAEHDGSEQDDGGPEHDGQDGGQQYDVRGDEADRADPDAEGRDDAG